MKYSDIYRLYSTSQPKDAIHQALREVPVDDSDEQYEDRSPLHLACQYGDTEGVKILLERDAEPNTKDANGSTGNAGIPFRGKKLVAGMYLSCQTVVNHLIVERAFLHLDGRGTEFNFYCCHEYICYLIFHLKTNPGETIA